MNDDRKEPRDAFTTLTAITNSPTAAQLRKVAQRFAALGSHEQAEHFQRIASDSARGEESGIKRAKMTAAEQGDEFESGVREHGAKGDQA